jgi:DNA primase catalytic core
MDYSNIITQVKEIAINEYLEQRYGYTGKGKGKNIFFHCPFHNERTPSFAVWDKGKMWTCHGACNKSGDIISLVEGIERVEFVQALEVLCQWAGIKFSYQESPHLQIVNKAAELYHKALPIAIKKIPLVGNWFKQREITQETIEFFKLGCTPFNAPDRVTKILLRDYEKKDLIIAGLSVEKDGKLLDRYKNSVIIPIKNFNGKIVGFSSMPLPVRKSYKYVNSTQSYFFNKRHLLFNMNDAKKDNSLIVVEGYTDLFAIRQQGFFNVVATMGVPTYEQIQSIPKHITKIYLAFDNNKAGVQFTENFMETLPSGHHLTPDNIRFIIYDGDDPDECITKNGGIWSNSLSLSVPILAYMHSKIHDKVNGNISAIIKELAIYYAKLKPVEFDENVLRLHKWIGNNAILPESIRTQMVQEINTWKGEQITVDESEFTTEQYVLCSYIWKSFILGVDMPNGELAIDKPEEVFLLDRHVRMYNACFSDGVFIGQNLDKFRDLSEYFDILTDLYEAYLARYHVNVERDLRGDIIKSVARLKQAVLRKKLNDD